MLHKAEERFRLNTRIRELLLESLDLPDHPDHIDFDQPLFGRGLELDSLDTLEIVSMVEEEFGVFIPDEERISFGSINRLVDTIRERL